MKFGIQTQSPSPMSKAAKTTNVVLSFHEDGNTEYPTDNPPHPGIVVDVISLDEIEYGAEIGEIVYQGREQHEAQRFLERFLLPIGSAQDEQGLQAVGLEDGRRYMHVAFITQPRDGERQRDFGIEKMDKTDSRKVCQYGG